MKNATVAKCDGSVHTMPEQFENGTNFDGKNSLQDFDAKDLYLHPKNRSILTNVLFLSFSSVSEMCRLEFRFQNLLFLKFCRQKICRFRVNGRPIRHIFHRFQNVAASCERSLRKPHNAAPTDLGGQGKRDRSSTSSIFVKF